MTLQHGNSFLSAYLDQNKFLIQTMVVKSSMAARLINESLQTRLGSSVVDDSDPTTWKYYLNLSGNRHWTDPVISVVSLDTHETIEFSVANLQRHTATAKGYAFGTRYFYSLLSKYPEDEALIMGVLTPVDRDTAIAAADGTILGYPRDLVEPQEVTLVEELQDYIQMFLTRYNIKAFQTSDTYFTLALYGVLAMHLYGRLLNLRLKRCHTTEVHSFHVRQFLGSHGYLDRFIPYLTQEQILYLYRNIRYLEHHNGLTEQFGELIEKLLSTRRIPLSEYSVRHQNSFDSENYPNIIARRKSIGTLSNVVETELIPMDVLYGKEADYAYGNPRYIESDLTREVNRFRVHDSAVSQTKVLESAMVDYSDAVPDPLTEVLLRQWAHMSFHGLYPAIVYFNDPLTGERRGLFAKDAFIYFNYVSLRSIGLQMTNIPKFTNVKFRRHPRPDVQELLQLIPKGMEDLVPVAYKLVDNQPALQISLSVTAFYDQAYQIFEESMKHWFLLSNSHEPSRHGILKQMVLKLFGYEWMDFGDEQTYDQWLFQQNLPEYNYTYEQAQNLARVIFEAATGYAIDDTKLLKNIQRNLIELFTQLSSYSIQILREINDSTIIPLNWSAIRVGDHQEHAFESVRLGRGVRVTGLREKPVESMVLTKTLQQSILEGQQYPTQGTHVHAGLDVIAVSKVEIQVKAFRTGVIYDASYEGMDPAVSARSTYIGAEWYQRLSEEQRLSIKSVY